MIFLFLRHSSLYDLEEETHFIQVIYFLVLVNTRDYLEFSTFSGPTEPDVKKWIWKRKDSWNSSSKDNFQMEKYFERELGKKKKMN